MEIAKGYGVAWSPNKGEDNGADGGVKVCDFEIPLAVDLILKVLLQEPIDDKAPGLESPVPVKAAAISEEARKAGVRTPRLPEIPPTEDEEGTKTKAVGKPPKEENPPEEDEFEALARRFQALKKR